MRCTISSNISVYDAILLMHTCDFQLSNSVHQQTLEIAVAPEDHHSTPVASAGLQLV